MTEISKQVFHIDELSFSALQTGSGPLVLCLHGFPDNAGTFRHQLPVLAEAGYHAVSVTLRGYEPGSQPSDKDYSLDTLAGDVISFLDELGVLKAHLVGHDWGAAIAYRAGALAPRRFTSLTTLAVPPAGRFLNEALRFPRQLLLSWYMLFFKLRGLAEYTLERNDYRFIRKLWRDWSPGWGFSEEEFQDVLATFREPGVKTAALSYYRTALTFRAFTPAARSANQFQVPVPTLAIAGEQDGCIDARVFEQMMHEEDFPRGLEFRQLAGAGHFLHREQPDKVNRLILGWLKKWEAGVSA